MNADLERKLQRLLDKDAIVDLVHKYSYCVDHNLYRELPDLFTEDCVIDYGPGSPPVIRGRETFRGVVGFAPASDSGAPRFGFIATSHHNANVLVVFDSDDRATVRSSLYAWHRMAYGPTATGKAWNTTTPQVWGYYHDVVTRTADGWRFAERKLHMLDVESWHEDYHRAEHTAPLIADPRYSIDSQ